MEAAPTETRKYIIGWLTFAPGRRDDFMRIALPYAAACREEEGCVFFEINPSAADPDVVSIAECYASAEAHAAHLKKPLFEAMWGELHRRCQRGRFENIFAGRVELDSVEFDDKDPAPVTN
jgi:quinol monooxygenase YgiN